jgi:hypothetical protein
VVGQLPDHTAHLFQRDVPRPQVALLRPHVERQPHVEPGLGGGQAEAQRVVGAAPELARQRPVGPDAVGAQPHGHDRTGRGARDLVELGSAIDGVQPHAQLVGARDVTFLLHRVAVRDPPGFDAAREARVDLRGARDVEPGAEAGEQPEDGRSGVRLDGVEQVDPGERRRQLVVALGHHGEVDDQARGIGAVRGEELRDPRGDGVAVHVIVRAAVRCRGRALVVAGGVREVPGGSVQSNLLTRS